MGSDGLDNFPHRHAHLVWGLELEQDAVQVVLPCALNEPLSMDLYVRFIFHPTLPLTASPHHTPPHCTALYCIPFPSPFPFPISSSPGSQTSSIPSPTHPRPRRPGYSLPSWAPTRLSCITSLG